MTERNKVEVEPHRFELVQRGLRLPAIFAFIGGGTLMVVALRPVFQVVMGDYRPEEVGQVLIVWLVMTLVGGMLVSAGRQHWRLRGQVLYIVRCVGQKLMWGPTGSEHELALSDIASARRIDGAGDTVTTVIKLKNGQTVMIDGPFGRHSELLQLLTSTLEQGEPGR